MSSIRRLLQRPSVRLIRSILIPLTAIHVAITVYAIFVSSQTANSIAYDRAEAIAQAVAMQETPTGGSLARLAEQLGAHRIWFVSATGRIVASSRPSEADAVVDDVWWQDLPAQRREFRQRRLWGGHAYVQVAYHDIERGVWSMIIADARSPLVSASARMLAILLFSLTIWLMLAGAVAVIIQRRLGKGLDLSDLVARKALSGEPVSSASLARTKASISSFGPGTRLLALVERMQERANRANEAESRFSLAVELLPGVAYLASFDGTLLWAGPVLRQRLEIDTWLGQPIDGLIPELPLERVHKAALQSHARGVTFDHLPVREETPRGPAMVASLRSVVFRGVPGYLAHLETVNDAGLATRDSRSRPDPEVLEQLVDAAGDVIVAFDGATRTVVWNQAARELTGKTVREAPDLRRAIETLTVNTTGIRAFADWMDGAPDQTPLKLDAPGRDGQTVRMSWTAREVTYQGRVVGGALFGRREQVLLPTADTPESGQLELCVEPSSDAGKAEADGPAASERNAHKKARRASQKTKKQVRSPRES